MYLGEVDIQGVKSDISKVLEIRKDVSVGCLHKILSCLTDIRKVLAIDINEHSDRGSNLCYTACFQNPREEGVGLEETNT